METKPRYNLKELSDTQLIMLALLEVVEMNTDQRSLGWATMKEMKERIKLDEKTSSITIKGL
jgi:hypothetical protein